MRTGLAASRPSIFAAAESVFRIRRASDEDHAIAFFFVKTSSANPCRPSAGASFSTTLFISPPEGCSQTIRRCGALSPELWAMRMR